VQVLIELVKRRLAAPLNQHFSLCRCVYRRDDVRCVVPINPIATNNQTVTAQACNVNSFA
jgi:hypothetical protein